MILILEFAKKKNKKKNWYHNLVVRRHIFLTEMVEKDELMWRNLNNKISGHETGKITI